jgi:hypothetical protein
MGEPLHNFEHLKDALHILQSEEGPNFSHRHITVSTVGLVPMIARLGAETDVKLAISLNASTDAQRDELMPVNRKWKIADLMEACRQFPLRQGRRITFEYVLLRGVNDTDADAERLVELLRDVPAKVNLIPYNENPGLGFFTTGDERAESFRRSSRAATSRRSSGRTAGGTSPPRAASWRIARDPARRKNPQAARRPEAQPRCMTPPSAFLDALAAPVPRRTARTGCGSTPSSSAAGPSRRGTHCPTARACAAAARSTPGGCSRAGRSRTCGSSPHAASRAASSPPAAEFYGTTLRVYDPGLDAWHILWSDPMRQVYRRQVGRAEGPDIVQLGTDDQGAKVRWSFQDRTEDSFRWWGERSPDGGVSWTLVAEFLARRTPGRP